MARASRGAIIHHKMATHAAKLQGRHAKTSGSGKTSVHIGKQHKEPWFTQQKREPQQPMLKMARVRVPKVK